LSSYVFFMKHKTRDLCVCVCVCVCSCVFVCENSKTFRKIRKKAQNRKADEEGEDDDLDTLAAERLKAERERAVERMRLKHGNTSKWAQQGMRMRALGWSLACAVQVQQNVDVDVGQLWL
jgi:hypothetical protein